MTSIPLRHNRDFVLLQVGQTLSTIGSEATALAYPLLVQGHIWKPFASYEAFHERNGGWNRHRIWSGVTLPVNKRLFVQPSYMWESSDGSRDIHYLLLGLIVNTR